MTEVKDLIESGILKLPPPIPEEEKLSKVEYFEPKYLKVEE